jgi:folate-binding protein YgfZ
MSQRLALHDAHRAAGATLESICGWEVPLAYGDPAVEYAAVRRRVGVIDRGDHGVVAVTGRDRASFLHALLSNEIKALRAGQGCSAALLDVHGKVQVILRVWVLEERILLVTPPGQAAVTVEALDKYLFAEKVALEDASAEFALFLLAGPEAPALVAHLTGGAAPEDAPWSHVTTTLDDIDVRLVGGGGETGAPERWIVGPAAKAARLWAVVVAAGALPVGLTAFEALRIEAGTPVLGHDVDGSVLLPEIPFERLLSYTKGCYPGQEVVVRIRDRGHVNRLLRGLVIDGASVPSPGADVVAADETASGAVIGRVTSAAWSFGLARPVALAFIRRQHAEPGTRVAVRAGEDTVPAAVSALPMVP